MHLDPNSAGSPGMKESRAPAGSRSPQAKTVSGIERFLRRHGYFLLFLFVLGFGVYNLYLSILPLDFDNVYALHMAARTGFLGLLKGVRFAYPPSPFYRPVAHATMMLQYRIWGLDTTYYFLLNLLVWIACSWGIYGVVAYVSKSRTSAAAAAAFLLLDPRAAQALYWIQERQTSLCVLFGVAALLLAMMPARRPRSRLRWVAIFLLLVASPLSKEYGLAFMGSLILLAAFRKDHEWKALIAIALLAAGAYGVIRFLSGITNYTDYCETMGFFQQVHQVCYSSLDLGARLQQHAYNVGSSFVGTVLPGLFGVYGEMDPRLQQILIVDTPMLLLALFGLVKSPRETFPLLALVILNAILCFVLYRPRNQLVGVLGLYAAAGIGLSHLLRAPLLDRHVSLRWPVLLALTTILSLQTVQATHLMVGKYEEVQHLDPCKYSPVAQVDPDIVYQIKIRFGLRDPRCRDLSGGG